MSAKKAIEKFSMRALGQTNRKKRAPNKKPEKSTEIACMEWFLEYGFSMHVVEAKAVWSKAAGRYLNGQVAPGFSDSAGCTPDGIGCFVEFKAKDRISTLRPAQREFLKEKIIKGCFACVVDGIERLKENYAQWRKAKRQSDEDAISYLLSVMPKDKSGRDDDGPLF